MRPCTIALSRLHPPRRKAFGRLPRPPAGLTPQWSPKSILHWSTCTPITLVSGLERFLALSPRISLRRPGKTPDVLCPLLRYRPAPQFPSNNIPFAQRTACGGIEAAACGCECVDQHPFRAITFPLRNGRRARMRIRISRLLLFLILIYLLTSPLHCQGGLYSHPRLTGTEYSSNSL
ncbi:hypothetical protein B0H14DRAFT_3690447, partial [Mycena olivaceomarginata]